MCGSQWDNNACCPDGQVFQEKICGNLAPGNDLAVWDAAEGGVDDYLQGTFEVFNAGDHNIQVTIRDASNQIIVGVYDVPPQTTVTKSANKPAKLVVTVPETNKLGSKYCITLYKRVI
ncbi:S-Ena type endospore appendage [Guptibacillus algicola]|uniref:S-Ena type endospore appendage n=1 Tax=Guptibacillus algicola TaxID=225844 RepID=UPI001CD36CCA|nr:S-Ena type endospore appendage [Alkalihalobacillus algicola]MCA0986509.1 hypothetical protein [Alkalihalobacillus algicola]